MTKDFINWNELLVLAGTLTEREWQIFCWYGQGHTTKEIADMPRWRVSVKTVETIRRSMIKKLGISNMTARPTYILIRLYEIIEKLSLQRVKFPNPIRFELR